MSRHRRFQVLRQVDDHLVRFVVSCVVVAVVEDVLEVGETIQAHRASRGKPRGDADAIRDFPPGPTSAH